MLKRSGDQKHSQYIGVCVIGWSTQVTANSQMIRSRINDNVFIHEYTDN